MFTADVLSELAVLLKNMKRFDEAEPMYRETLAIREKRFGNHPITAQSYNNLGVFLRGRGDEAGALEHQRRGLEIYRSVLGEHHLEVGIAHANVAAALRGLKRYDEAEASYKASLAAIGGSMGPKYWVYGNIESNYGTFLRDQKRFSEAEARIVRGYEVMRDGLGAEARRTLLVLDTLVQFYEKWGKPARAAEYRKLIPAKR